MPRGLRTLESIEKVRATRAKTREARQSFLIKINDTIRVSRDAYNVILFQKCTAEDTGNVYVMPLGYFSEFNRSLLNLAREHGVTEEHIQAYSERVKDIKAQYQDGKLVLNIPQGFAFDIDDSVEETSNE